MKHRPYTPLNQEDQLEKSRILSQMEVEAYWKKKMQQQDRYHAMKIPFDPFAFRFKIDWYARHHHRTKHELVRMSEYCRQLQRQGTRIKARIKQLKGVS